MRIPSRFLSPLLLIVALAPSSATKASASPLPPAPVLPFAMASPVCPEAPALQGPTRPAQRSVQFCGSCSVPVCIGAVLNSQCGTNGMGQALFCHEVGTCGEDGRSQCSCSLP
jgi:hypothetical protein